jgi:hypothetical protein
MKNTKPLTEVEWDTCWMAIRYSMGRQTIASATLPRQLCEAYFDRWSEGQKRTIVRDLRQHLQDKARWNGESTAHFGDKNIDHPEWMRFLLSLDKNSHITIKDNEGNKHTAFKFNGKIHPLDWWKYTYEAYFNPEMITFDHNSTPLQ